MKKLITLVALMCVMSCSETKIEQRVERDSRIACTYCVKTYVWQRTWFGLPVNIERSYISSNLSKDQVETEKNRQRIAAEIIEEALKDALESECE